MKKLKFVLCGVAPDLPEDSEPGVPPDTVVVLLTELTAKPSCA